MTPTTSPINQASTSDISIDWESVYTDTLPGVFRFFSYRIGDTSIAEDLTAITFEKAWKTRHNYRHDLGAFVHWLFGIARKVAADHYRKAPKETSLDEYQDLAGGQSVENVAQHNSDFAHLTSLLTELPERERELLSLKYGAELTNRRIANLTGISESNVGTIIHRVVNKLRTQWEQKS